MHTTTLPDRPSLDSHTAKDSEPSAIAELKHTGPPWHPATYLALATLVVLWAAKVYTTWTTWGNLTIDSGHEMYIPALLAEGKQLYRDVWFMYGPASPYINSWLFRLFGIHLNVLYWAGSLSALGSALFLFLVGRRLSSTLAGWTAGAVLLLEAFQPNHFCFPLPYTFAAVYGCLVGCLFLWLAVEACYSSSLIWVFSAGTAAALALLLKPEFGTACYLTLGILIAVRGLQQRSWKSATNSIIAVLPGVAICIAVVAWMISIKGIDFITQENVLSWPTSYFMRTYGQMWLEGHGFTLSLPAFEVAMWRAVPLIAVALAAYSILWWPANDKRSILVRVLIMLGVILIFKKHILYVSPLPIPLEQILSPIFFPQDMVLYICVAAPAAWVYFWRHFSTGFSPALALLLSFSSLLAFRILMAMGSIGYPIYYNGPVVLCFLLLACRIVPRAGRWRRLSPAGELLICLACLTAVALYTRKVEAKASDFVTLATQRGTIRVAKHTAEGYEAAIRFMQEKASRGEVVLSVPEDTSLYFLSGTHCPTRVFSFTPGSLAPGKMIDETIEQIERKPVRYLLWSNRTFPDFGTPIFGEDFDRPLGDYLKAHYQPVRPLLPNANSSWPWTEMVWERKSDTAGTQAAASR